MEDYLTHQGISNELFKTQIGNLKLYGYGIKGYILSMIEASMNISDNTIRVEVIEKIIQCFVVFFLRYTIGKKKNRQ